VLIQIKTTALGPQAALAAKLVDVRFAPDSRRDTSFSDLQLSANRGRFGAAL
jgi:hypothetical protein